MLLWHRRLWLIDHGATLFFHHTPDGRSAPAAPREPFPLIDEHVLLPRASELRGGRRRDGRGAHAGGIEGIVGAMPDAWLRATPRRSAERARAAYAAICSTGCAAPALSSRRPPCPLTPLTYDYAIIRVVPRVERGEQINVGVILSCVDDDFLEARIELDEARCGRSTPTLDLDALRGSLATIPAVCRRRRRGGTDRRAAGARSGSAGWPRRAARSSRRRRSTPDEPGIRMRRWSG